MPELDEQFGTHLTRVIKNVKKRTKGGGTRTVKQTYHVRKANPGDQYSAKTQRDMGMANIDLKSKPRQPQLPAVAQVAPELPPEQAPQELQNRVQVRYHDLAWTIVTSGPDGTKRKDPVPQKLRDRFLPKNRATQISDPMQGDVPLNLVNPSDPVLWGADEPRVLNELRAGAITRLKLIGRDNGMMLGRVECSDSTSINAYVRLESLTDPYLYVLWGDFYGLEKGNGSVPKRAAAAYEIAKATGFDDLVPPTVVRFDEFGDMAPILPKDLLERFNWTVESLARRTGEDPETIRSTLGGYACLQVLKGDCTTIEREEWFVNLFKADTKGKPTNVLNRIFEAMPDDRRMAFLRVAVYDFVLWSGDRHLGSFTFCEDDRHPLHLIGNELCAPCPRKMGLRVLEDGLDTYVTDVVNPKGGVPMLWSECATMVATRGTKLELDDYEKIGHYVHHRMDSDFSFELARSLVEHDLSPLAVAGVLSRAWFLGSHAREIARDPYFIARYYADLIAERDVSRYEGIETYINSAMRKVLIRDFDFAKLIREEEEDASETS